MGALLGADELPTVEVREGQGPFVFVCEHASNTLPRSLGTLGLSAADLDRHIAWDPGAAAIAEGLVARLGGDLVLQRYSRLAIDCNRHFDLPDAVATASEDTPIPAMPVWRQRPVPNGSQRSGSRFTVRSRPWSLPV